MATDESRRGDGVLRMPRSRGALSGLLLVLLGVWGALMPFLGPVFDYGFGPGAWEMTWARFWYQLLPGLATIVGGFLVLVSANRVTALVGGWIAAAAGAWYVVGPFLATLLPLGTIGAPISTSELAVAAEVIGLFEGLGAAIVLLAGLAIGRASVRGIREVRAAEREREREREEREREARDRELREMREREIREREARAAQARVVDPGPRVVETGPAATRPQAPVQEPRRTDGPEGGSVRADKDR